MFRKIKRHLRLGKQQINIDTIYTGIDEPLPKNIEKVKKRLDEIFSGCDDFIQRQMVCGEDECIRILVSYIDGLVDKNILNRDIIRPVIDYLSSKQAHDEPKLVYQRIKECVVSSSDFEEIQSMQQAVYKIVSGDAVLFVDGVKDALAVNVKTMQGRQIDEPDTEISIRGPREGFVENLATNMMLIRKRIKSPNLKFEIIQLGVQTKTDVCICYIKGIANEEIVKEVRKRLKKIKTDAILDTGYIEQYITDNRLTLFPIVGNTEKCDKLVAKLLEGRVAILCDGTPYIITVPYIFIESIQTSDDYYDHAFFASFMRLLRSFALIISNLLPAMYVALVSFHHTVIPIKLMITLAASRQGIPFSPFVEAVLMITAFELLREAGVRMPRTIGQALSIVGAIVLGEASVAAGIASNLMVIVVAITAICSFVVPPLIRATMLLRFAFLVAANFLGFLGISFVAVAVFIHLCRLRSFGIPYMAPFSPLTASDIKDSLGVVPIWAMLTRPKILFPENTKDTVGIKRQEVDEISED
ncbi:spore germination protein [Caldicoprobacter algeriensis]|uniref:spore germination protein n=1 Tax=Caldicoprobacter algeriensis TaxID=699281 RepID=UPI00207A40BD|nr:spore germination protein [Caldicoprobacter algeriensis]MCM8900736.1 spore germination protein [Caldicoprobacter algeriensis]